MTINSEQLEAIILRGARVAQDSSVERTLEQWLGSAHRLVEVLGHAHLAERIGEWRQRVCDGLPMLPLADFAADDRHALVAACRAFVMIEELDRLASGAEAA
jgi:hypothetical protein